MAGAFIGVEKQIEQRTIEEAPAGIEGLSDENRLCAALREGVIELPHIERLAQGLSRQAQRIRLAHSRSQPHVKTFGQGCQRHCPRDLCREL